MATKRPAIGPRVTAAIGTKKVGNETKTFYSYMPKTVADLYGFKPVAAPKTKPKKQGQAGRLLRGSFGAGSIKVPIDYRLQHRFSDNWSIRNGFRVELQSFEESYSSRSLRLDNRAVNRIGGFNNTNTDNYVLQTDVLGRIQTVM